MAQYLGAIGNYRDLEDKIGTGNIKPVLPTQKPSEEPQLPQSGLTREDVEALFEAYLSGYVKKTELPDNSCNCPDIFRMIYINDEGKTVLRTTDGYEYVHPTEYNANETYYTAQLDNDGGATLVGTWKPKKNAEPTRCAYSGTCYLTGDPGIDGTGVALCSGWSNPSGVIAINTLRFQESLPNQSPTWNSGPMYFGSAHEWNGNGDWSISFVEENNDTILAGMNLYFEKITNGTLYPDEENNTVEKVINNSISYVTTTVDTSVDFSTDLYIKQPIYIEIPINNLIK